MTGAPGFYFSRWGKDNPREEIAVFDSTFYRNGCGRSASGDQGGRVAVEHHLVHDTNTTAYPFHMTGMTARR